MEELTGDLILEQMRRDYGRSAFGRLILLLLPAAAMGASAYLRGIKDPVTIILAVLTAAALIYFMFGLYRVIFIEKHPLIQQFGSAIALAGCIRAGGPNTRRASRFRRRSLPPADLPDVGCSRSCRSPT